MSTVPGIGAGSRAPLEAPASVGAPARLSTPRRTAAYPAINKSRQSRQAPDSSQPSLREEEVEAYLRHLKSLLRV